MDNIQEDNRETWFIDVDGTLVVHNYKPEEYNDVFLPGAVEKLQELQERAVIILTTSRTSFHMDDILSQLRSMMIRIDGVICNLPTGKRVLVNDNKPATPEKAEAVCLERNVGWSYEII